MNYWFILNAALFIISIVLVTRDFSWAVFFAVCGLMCILFNWNMHAIFSRIRNLDSRNKRIRIAKCARRIMPFHVTIGVTGLVLIVFHVLLILRGYGLTNLSLKTVSGGIAFAGLTAILVSGYLRRKKATGKRRRAHLYLSMLLFFLMTLHIIL